MQFLHLGFAPDLVDYLVGWQAQRDVHAQVVDGGAFAGKPWNKQHESMTAARPIKLYRPDGR